MSRRLGAILCATAVMGALMGVPGRAFAAAVPGLDVTYTNDSDFDKGTTVNLNHTSPNSNQLQLNKTSGTFPNIWIALSQRCTIAKINTTTGDILGEYRTISDGASCNESSRTTVMLDGTMWVGHRGAGGITHVGLSELNQCIDRNNSGTIETSTGYGDVKAWTGSDSLVANAVDECILTHVDTVAAGLSDSRHVSVDSTGNLWIGDYNGGHKFIQLNGQTGAILTAVRSFSCGGYGGFVDGNGVIWSSNGGNNGLLRWDPNAADSGSNPQCIAIPVYGLAIDRNGYVWANMFSGGQVRKVSPDGSIIAGPFSNGQSGYSQGLAADANGDIWTSSGLYCGSGCTIGHLKNDGTLIGNVPNPTGAGTTGVAVDAAGKIWTANRVSNTATRIDPTLGPVGTDSVTPIGQVDKTVDFPAGPDGRPSPSPYNYSDMTGTVALSSTSPQGSWTVTQNGGSNDVNWHTIFWNNESQGFVPPGGELSVKAEARSANSEAGLGALGFQEVQSCRATTGLNGRFVQVRFTLKPNSAGVSPVLSDVTIRGGNASTDCGKKKGYCLIGSDDGEFCFDLPYHSSSVHTRTPRTATPSGTVVNAPFVGAAITPTQAGYWAVGADGGVFSHGDAQFYGSLSGVHINAPIVGMASTGSGGYWLAGSDGGVYAFGNAVFYGSTGSIRLNKPVVGIAATPSGLGYWLVASDGGVFAFGDAVFSGSTGSITLNKPMVGMAGAPTGGYWLVASDGGVFAFGGAGFFGSTGSITLTSPAVSIASTPSGAGYTIAAGDGGVFNFGDSTFSGNAVGLALNGPIVAIISI